MYYVTTILLTFSVIEELGEKLDGLGREAEQLIVGAHPNLHIANRLKRHRFQYLEYKKFKTKRNKTTLSVCCSPF